MNQRNHITPEELRAELVSKGIDTSTVDFELLAEAQNNAARDVPGWEAPRVLPADWREIDRDKAGGARYDNVARSLRAILSCSVESDGRAWLHLSVSHRQRIPTHGEMRTVKELFLGNRYAYAVWPPMERYVNLHQNVLHVFALLDERAEQPLPDFTGGSGSL
jgi:hypothetical protein